MTLTKQDLSAIGRVIDIKLDTKLKEQDSRIDQKLKEQDKRFDNKLATLRKHIYTDISATLSIGLTAVDKRIDKLEKQIQS